MGLIAKKFVLKNTFKGEPKLKDFELLEEELPEHLKEGEILAKAGWLTVDPYMRIMSPPPGETLIGGQVANVLKSRNPEFPEGSTIYGFFGWRDLTIHKPDPNGDRNHLTIYKLPDFKGLSTSHALGAVGMPGSTGYFGLLKICKPQPGETLVVTAAAGAVGSIVGQVGKLMGCKVIGFVGSDEKVKFLEEELGFDKVLNYNNIDDLDKTLKEFAPNGIDCYFDNVGGEFTYHVIRNMNTKGRIAQCGSISSYNDDESGDDKPDTIPRVPFDYPQFRIRQIKMEGFMVAQWSDELFDGLNQLRDWIVEGKIRAEESVTVGFENMPRAFIDLMNGKNTGKQVIKIRTQS